jgi:hypothetical protein
MLPRGENDEAEPTQGTESSGVVTSNETAVESCRINYLALTSFGSVFRLHITRAL